MTGTLRKTWLAFAQSTFLVLRPLLYNEIHVSGHPPARNFKVLVKCRQNVANKLFITRIFNPLHPHTYNLTALSALLYSRLLNALICTKEVKASSFSLLRYRICIQYCCSGCCLSCKCWLCGTTASRPPIGGPRLDSSALVLD